MSNTETTNDTNEICKRLDALIGILFTPELQSDTNQNKIAYLTLHNFNNNAIAKILNTSSNTVSKEKSLLKKKGKNNE